MFVSICVIWQPDAKILYTETHLDIHKITYVVIYLNN